MDHTQKNIQNDMTIEDDDERDEDEDIRYLEDRDSMNELNRQFPATNTRREIYSLIDELPDLQRTVLFNDLQVWRQQQINRTFLQWLGEVIYTGELIKEDDGE